jgi:hypothetical protein
LTGSGEFEEGRVRGGTLGYVGNAKEESTPKGEVPTAIVRDG